jgi:NAD(P)-dependent dehydrogenase (short-subunit alcohol dehydrogenase family)
MSEATVHQLFDLTGKTSLITGASGHLGGALARALAEAGSRVVVTSRDLERAREVAVKLPDPNSVGHFGAVLDHMDTAQLEAHFGAIVEKSGRIDVLVNNGHEHCANDWTDISGEQFTRVLANATGYFLLARLVRQHALYRSAPVSVIMLGSMYGQVASYPDAYNDIGPASSVAYHTLKGGVLHLTRHLAIYWADDGVRVNSLSPGPFPADSVAPGLIDSLEKHSPLRRMGRPDELKGAVVFLASDASSYMTGQNLVIDGGWTAW